MSTATATVAMPEMIENVPPTAEPPPIVTLLPLLQLVLAGLSLLLRLAFRSLLTMVYPLHTIWYILHGLLSPILIVLKIAFSIVLLTPFSIIRTVAVALYPIYVFCAAACIVGAAVGILGQYISTTIVSTIARATYFTRPSSPSPATRPSTPQAMLRKRKRKSVRLQ